MHIKFNKITSSKVSSGCSVIGICLLTWMGKLIRELDDCRSALTETADTAKELLK